MQKYKLWLLFFFTIFSFTMGMIVWTIMSASKAPVHKDESFLREYADVDANYNEIVLSNKKFNEMYDASIYVGGKKLPISIDEVFMSQRMFDTKSQNKKLLTFGDNNIEFEIKDKNGIVIKNPIIKLRVTRTMDHYNDINIENFDLVDGKYTADAKVEKEGNWNLTGFIEIDSLKGSFFIKTSTK